MNNGGECSDYADVVERLYLRQAVTETRGVADLAVDHYRQLLSESDVADPFGDVASSFSCQRETAENNGTIGWVDTLSTATAEADFGSDNGGSGEAVDGVLAADVLRQLCERKPKAGDMFVIESKTTRQWHVVQVAEVWLRPPPELVGAAYDGGGGLKSRPATIGTSTANAVGSHSGVNLSMKRRSKLRGKGVLPEFPTLRTYSIRTAGCQMNVADSERLAGILEGDLHLSPAGGGGGAGTDDGSADDADLVIWNTCSIRDKAERKLYDAVGPFAARKRDGKRVALIVTGCVAQQEGLDLLKRVPEIDAVVGPQYVPFLRNVVESVGMGNQVVATSPMMMQEDVGTATGGGGGAGAEYKPVRGHDVRAWVNVIYGCNEHW